MRVLVTGGAGYIGSHTLLELMAQGHDICVLDNYCNSSPEVIKRVHELSNRSVNAFEGDVRDQALLDQIVTNFRPEAVIHFAGLKAVGESSNRPVDYYDVNVTGTLRLLAAMDRIGCRSLIFSSSATVYGVPAYLPYDEAHPTNPTSVYGRSKLMVEQILSDWTKANQDVSAVILRYFNPVGAHSSARIGESPRGVPDNLMPYVAQVATGKRADLTIFGDDYDTADGTGERDYIHVVDLAKAHVAALDYSVQTQGARPFNIGTGISYSVRQMVTAFREESGHTIPTKVTSRRDGDVAAMKADPSRANKELGWTAELGLKEMAASLWAWQSSNPDGYNT